mmetsp:Transcript_30195/g.96407  ORF Transcript_30195/g.96407 Transcript_30195/m.96407 type:complete len:373 (+) Transcript_30195:265-1383(+)
MSPHSWAYRRSTGWKGWSTTSHPSARTWRRLWTTAPVPGAWSTSQSTTTAPGAAWRRDRQCGFACSPSTHSVAGSPCPCEKSRQRWRGKMAAGSATWMARLALLRLLAWPVESQQCQSPGSRWGRRAAVRRATLQPGPRCRLRSGSGGPCTRSPTSVFSWTSGRRRASPPRRRWRPGWAWSTPPSWTATSRTRRRSSRLAGRCRSASSTPRASPTASWASPCAAGRRTSGRTSSTSGPSPPAGPPAPRPRRSRRRRRMRGWTRRSWRPSGASGPSWACRPRGGSPPSCGTPRPSGSWSASRTRRAAPSPRACCWTPRAAASRAWASGRRSACASPRWTRTGACSCCPRASAGSRREVPSTAERPLPPCTSRF